MTNEFLEKSTVDLLFLVEEPLVNGLTFRKAFKHPAITIFTTAYKQYAFEGFQLHAADYLLKPFSLERFLKAVEKTGLLEKKQSDQTIAIRDEKGIVNLFQNQILCIEGMKDYIKIVTLEREYITYHTLKSMLEKLDPELFIQVHRSHIVNRAHVRHVAQEMIGLSNNTLLPIGKSFKKDLQRLLKW